MPKYLLIALFILYVPLPILGQEAETVVGEQKATAPTSEIVEKQLEVTPEIVEEKEDTSPKDTVPSAATEQQTTPSEVADQNLLPNSAETAAPVPKTEEAAATPNVKLTGNDDTPPLPTNKEPATPVQKPEDMATTDPANQVEEPVPVVLPTGAETPNDAASTPTVKLTDSEPTLQPIDAETAAPVQKTGDNPPTTPAVKLTDGEPTPQPTGTETTIPQQNTLDMTRTAPATLPANLSPAKAKEISAAADGSTLNPFAPQRAALLFLDRLGTISLDDRQRIEEKLQSVLDKNYTLIRRTQFPEGLDVSSNPCNSEECFELLRKSLEVDGMFIMQVAPEKEKTRLEFTLRQGRAIIRQEKTCEKCALADYRDMVETLIGKMEKPDLTPREPEPVPEKLEPSFWDTVPTWAWIAGGLVGAAVLASMSSSSDDGGGGSSGTSPSDDDGTVGFVW